MAGNPPPHIPTTPTTLQWAQYSAPAVPPHPATIAVSTGCASMNQPLPTVLATSLSSIPAVPAPGSYPLDRCGDGSCRVPVRSGGRPCLRRIVDWFCFQNGPPVIAMCQPRPHSAPMLAYFPCTATCVSGSCSVPTHVGIGHTGPSVEVGATPVRGRILAAEGWRNLLGRTSSDHLPTVETGEVGPSTRLGVRERMLSALTPTPAPAPSAGAVMAGYVPPPGFTATGVVVYGADQPFTNP